MTDIFNSGNKGTDVPDLTSARKFREKPQFLRLKFASTRVGIIPVGQVAGLYETANEEFTEVRIHESTKSALVKLKLTEAFNLIYETPSDTKILDLTEYAYTPTPKKILL